MMEVILTKFTPCDKPAKPVNSLLAGALAHGFWGGQITVHQRPELSGLVDVPTGETHDPGTDNFDNIIFDAPTGKISGKHIFEQDSHPLRLRGGGDSYTHDMDMYFHTAIMVPETGWSDRLIPKVLRIRGGAGDEDLFSTPNPISNPRKIKNAGVPGETHAEAMARHLEFQDEVHEDIKAELITMLDKTRIGKSGRIASWSWSISWLLPPGAYTLKLPS